MMTKEAIVKVNNQPVSNIKEYMNCVGLTTRELLEYWNNYEKEMQQTLGSNFVVKINKIKRIKKVWDDCVFPFHFKITVKKLMEVA